MSIRKTELHIDRIEDGVAVAYDNNENEYFIRDNISDIKENDILEATLTEDGLITSITVLHEKTEAKKHSMNKLLTNLFNKGV